MGYKLRSWVKGSSQPTTFLSFSLKATVIFNKLASSMVPCPPSILVKKISNSFLHFFRKTAGRVFPGDSIISHTLCWSWQGTEAERSRAVGNMLVVNVHHFWSVCSFSLLQEFPALIGVFVWIIFLRGGDFIWVDPPSRASQRGRLCSLYGL